MEDYKTKVRELIKINEDEALVYLEDYISRNFHDFDAIIACALLAQKAPFDDFITAIKLLQDLLNIDKYNVKALLLKAYVENIHLGEIDYSTFNAINYCLNLNNYNFYSIQLLVLQAQYYQDKDKIKYIETLQKSVNLDFKASYNFLLLGRATNNTMYLEQALNNVEFIYTIENVTDIDNIDFDEFINEHIRGTKISFINYEAMKQELNVARNC